MRPLSVRLANRPSGGRRLRLRLPQARELSLLHRLQLRTFLFYARHRSEPTSARGCTRATCFVEQIRHPGCSTHAFACHSHARLVHASRQPGGGFSVSLYHSAAAVRALARLVTRCRCSALSLARPFRPRPACSADGRSPNAGRPGQRFHAAIKPPSTNPIGPGQGTSHLLPRRKLRDEASSVAPEVPRTIEAPTDFSGDCAASTCAPPLHMARSERFAQFDQQEHSRLHGTAEEQQDATNDDDRNQAEFGHGDSKGQATELEQVQLF